MQEPQRQSSHSTSPGLADDADRESRIEQLLLAGLDQYFLGQFEQAIDIWTRVAFLERRNSRARAYIDRARGLLAERQREGEALVHEGVTAYEAGDLAAAKALLMRAVERGGQSDTALLFLDRLGRVETVPPPSPAPAARSGAPRARAVDTPNGLGRRWGWTVVASAALAAAILIGARPVVSLLSEFPVAAPMPAPAPLEPLPLARPSDRLLDRARALRADGRRRDALRVLGTVDVGDPLRREADGLRTVIQREILAEAAAARGSVPFEVNR